VLLVIAADQTLKIWVKTHMPLSHPTDFYLAPVTPYDNGIHLLGDKAQIYFVENEGMAMGMKFGGDSGKMILTLFRLMAVLFGVYYIRKIATRGDHWGFVTCAALIFAGALGNLIDSLFYGLIFERSTYEHVARLFPARGYTGFLQGQVVDMLYFPMIRTHFPEWVPFFGGKEFEFFADIFNIADASISVGVICILVFRQRFFRRVPQMVPVVEQTN
jgi:signal peptidase II